MASGTSYDFEIPQSKPIRKLDNKVFETAAIHKENNSDGKKACVPRMRSISYPTLIPQSVMLGSLLEHLCHLYESDSHKAKELFEVICKQLELLNIVSPVAYVEEYASVRHQYKTSFYSLIRSSLSTINNRLLLPPTGKPNNQKLRRSSKSSVFDLNASRYLEEYEEVCGLGRGAYGTVFKVRNKMDGQEYAIKKVPIKDNEDCDRKSHIDRIMREVQALASMQHGSIVRYHYAWMEHHTFVEKKERDSSDDDIWASSSNSEPFSLNPLNENNSHSVEFGSSGGSSINGSTLPSVNPSRGGKFWRSSSDGSCDGDGKDESSKNDETGLHFTTSKQDAASSYKDDSEKSDEVIFSQGVLNKGMRRVQSVVLLSPSHSLGWSHSLRKDRVQSYNDLAELALVKNTFLEKNFSDCLTPRDEIILYIQMQLCETSLTAWLHKRNDKCAKRQNDSEPFDTIDEIVSLDIAHQVFQALDYIHCKGVMHRDVKPRNILLDGSRPQVLLGDFGLARPTGLVKQNSSKFLDPLHDVTAFLESEQTTGVGTMIYAAPEQLSGGTYGVKADMYAAGIVFFELLWPWKTQHERVETIAELRREVIPEAFAQRWTKYVSTLRSLLFHNPDKRPSAREILDADIFHITKAELFFDQVSALKKENARLKQLVAKYEAKLNQHHISLE